MIQASLPLEKGAPVSDQDCARWHALGRIKGVGGVNFKKITTRFADPTAIFRASPAELAEIDGLRRDLIDNIANFADWAEIDDEIKRARAAGIKIIPFSAAAYPARLRAIADPPPLLYVKGEIRTGRQEGLGDCRSKNARQFRAPVAREFATRIAFFGFTVISG